MTFLICNSKSSLSLNFSLSCLLYSTLLSWTDDSSFAVSFQSLSPFFPPSPPTNI
jgi:hypothetical protein